MEVHIGEVARAKLTMRVNTTKQVSDESKPRTEIDAENDANKSKKRTFANNSSGIQNKAKSPRPWTKECLTNRCNGINRIKDCPMTLAK